MIFFVAHNISDLQTNTQTQKPTRNDCRHAPNDEPRMKEAVYSRL